MSISSGLPHPLELLKILAHLTLYIFLPIGVVYAVVSYVFIRSAIIRNGKFFLSFVVFGFITAATLVAILFLLIAFSYLGLNLSFGGYGNLLYYIMVIIAQYLLLYAFLKIQVRLDIIRQVISKKKIAAIWIIAMLPQMIFLGLGIFFKW